MRRSDTRFAAPRRLGPVLLPLLLAACLGPAMAFDGTRTDRNDPSPIEAFRLGARAYRAGDLVGATRALQFAADKGHALAQWTIGRMYAAGDGVPHDDFKAFEYFQALADAHADESPEAPQARVVASALVALGSYYLSGIPNTPVRSDPSRAADLFGYAASYFGDSDAQYNLGRLLLEGASDVPRDPLAGARWLRLSADKGQHQAQAVLGHLLFAGTDVPREPARGLMYLTLARDGAQGDGDAWIVKLYDQAVSSATPAERQHGLAFLEGFLKARQ